jgi:hypothetical protein
MDKNITVRNGNGDIGRENDYTEEVKISACRSNTIIHVNCYSKFILEKRPLTGRLLSTSVHNISIRQYPFLASTP